MNNKLIISSHDKTILRELAKQIAEIAGNPIQKVKAKQWTAHNDLKSRTPMVLVFPEGSWRELINCDNLKCESEYARNIEYKFTEKIYQWNNFQDDNVVTTRYSVPLQYRQPGAGPELHKTFSNDNLGAYHIDSVITKIEDFDTILPEEIIIDKEETEKHLNIAKDLFDDILDIELSAKECFMIAPMDYYSKIRGIDNLFFDLIDNPEMVHYGMDKITKRRIAEVKSLEKQGLLKLNLTNQYCGSGGNCYSSELPGPDYNNIPALKDNWGGATAQIFSEVSPEMHEEFALKYEKHFLKLFGLAAYGCCEPLHNKLEILFKHIPNLRRISISPWADIDLSAEKIQDKYIYSWKPNPADLAGPTWNPEAIRKQLTDFCERTKGNITEIIMKDTHTICNQPQRIFDWVRIAREVALKFAE